jgi:ureidoacrylate peracid hydrolase
MTVWKGRKESWEIDPEKTALVVIDMQRAFTDKEGPVMVPGAYSLVPGINELAAVCRQSGIPVIFVRMGGNPDLSDVGLRQEMREVSPDNPWEALHGNRGFEFCDGLQIMPEDYEVVKVRYSALIPGSSTLEPLLRGLGRDRFIICGIVTDVCVGSTAIDGMALGFRVFFSADLTASLSPERQKVALEVMGRHYARVMALEEIKESLRKGG